MANCDANQGTEHGQGSGAKFTRDPLSLPSGPITRLDKNIKDIKTCDPIQVPIGPMTRARAKRFKEELNELVRRVLQQEESVFTTKGEQKLILLIKVN